MILILLQSNKSPINCSFPLHRQSKESKLKTARMHIYVRRGGPNYQTGLSKMRALGEELGVPLEVLTPSFESITILSDSLMLKLNCIGMEKSYEHFVNGLDLGNCRFMVLRQQ